MEVKNEIVKATRGGIQGATSIPAVSKNMTILFYKIGVNIITGGSCKTQ
jgi:hypothetical protein